MLSRVFALCAALLVQGCALVVPFIEPDEQAKLNGRPAVREYRAETVYTPRRPVPVDTAALRVRELTANLTHPRAAVRVNAATDLGALGSKAKPAVPDLIARLRDDSFWVRRASAKALGRLKAKEAVPELRRCLNDRDKYVALSAKRAITQIVN